MQNSRFPHTGLLSPIAPVKKSNDNDTPSPSSFVTPRREASHSSFFSSTRLTPSKSPRYGLAEHASRSNREQSFRAGPLLASTQFNVSLGTYTDAKSPGLTSRIVQYDNEQKERIPTHQSRYGSPGLFPIVHFFKKEIPVITPKQQNRVTVKLASPDSFYNGATDTLNTTHEETQSNVHRDVTNEPDVSTRSVLDALKEISRKRIHGGEDYETNQQDTTKRPKRIDYSLKDYGSKRARDDSPPKADGTPTKPAAKRLCVIDPVYASYTSYSLYMAMRQKSRASLQEIKNPLKHRKLTNTGTQTINSEPAVIDLVNVNDKVKKSLPTKKQGLEKGEPVKMAVLEEKNSVKVNKASGDAQLIQDAVPEELQKAATSSYIQQMTNYEALKKAKLALLVATSNGDDPTTEKIDTTNEQPIKSILSPQNKAKHDKHVHFNLESSESTVATIPTEVTATTPAAVTVSSTINSSSFNIDKPAVTSSTALPMFNFESPKTTAPTLPVLTTPSSNTGGGFKFNLSPTSTATTSAVTSDATQISPAPMFNFGLSDNKNTTPVTSGFPKNTKTPEKTVAPFTMPTITNNTTSVSSTFTFVPPVTTTSGAGFMFNSPTSNNTFTPSAPASLSAATSANVTSSGFSIAPALGTSFPTIPAYTAVTSTPATTATNSSFSNNTTSAPTGFGISNSTSSPFNIAPKTTFGNATTTSTNQNQPTNSTFGVTTTTTSSIFSGGFDATLQNKPILDPKLSKPAIVSTAFTFGASATSSTFGTNTQSTSIFGASTTSTHSFGAPVSSSSIFGSKVSTPSSTSAKMFGPPGYGTATTNSIAPQFGIGSNKATGGFGESKPKPSGFAVATSAPAFGVATSAPAFGVATTTAFGNSSIFGSATTTATSSGFGFGTTTTATNFGSSTTTTASVTPSFGFGQPTTTASTFGSTTNTTTSGFSNPIFTSFTTSAAPATTTSGPIFAFGGGAPSFSKPAITTNKFSFGPTGDQTFVTTAPTPFGTTTTTSGGFGSTNSTFGSNQTSVFGGVTTYSTFGTTTTQPTFGTATTQSAFGTTTTQPTFGPSTTQPAFGAAQPFGAATTTQSSTFGTTPTPAFGSSTTSTFGTKTTATPFGTSTPAFGATSASTFGVTTTANNTFGSTPTTTNSTFGANNNNAFGSANTTPFGSPSTFGSSTFGTGNFGGSVAQQNTTFGATNNTSSPFGSTPAPAFNNMNTATPQAGVFSFGTANPVQAAPAKPSGVFSFGAAEAPKAGSFNFSANSSGFGSGTPNFLAAGFGSPAAAASFNSQQFNSPPAVFSIGSGSTTKSRAQLKAKRRP